MAKKVKKIFKNNMVLCVLVLVAVGLTSVVFAADVKIKQGKGIFDELVVDTNALVVDVNGNVGIGTAEPQWALHLHRTSSPMIHLTTGDTGSGASDGLRIEEGVGGVGFLDAQIWNLENGYLRFGTNAAERLRITNSGNVGIGTTSPTALLDINSDILRLRSSKTPSSASDTGNAGDICWDSSYIYVCVATNTWKRTALSTW